MSPTPTVLAALAASCRLLANSNLADKKDVLEFHLRWVDLCRRDCTEELDDLAFRMAQFVVNHERVIHKLQGTASIAKKEGPC